MIIDDLNGAEPSYIKSFGFSALIEVGDKKILFDTGTKVYKYQFGEKCTICIVGKTLKF